MSQDLTPMETFTKKVEDKIRDDIAQMLPDEVIAEMVQKATHQLFFERTRRNIGTHYNPQYVDDKSKFEELVQEAILPIVETHAKMIVAEQIVEIQTTIDDSLKRGLATLVIQSIDNLLRNAAMSQEWNLRNSIVASLRQAGVNIQ